MGNSVPRGRVRRTAAFVEVLEDVLRRNGIQGHWIVGEALDLARDLERELAERGLCLADIGGQQVDDDGAHRMEYVGFSTQPDPRHDPYDAEPAPPADDLTDLLAEAQRIRTRSGRTAEVVGLLLDRLEQPRPSPAPDDGRGPRLVPRRDPQLCWRIHPGAEFGCQLPDGHDLLDPEVDRPGL